MDKVVINPRPRASRPENTGDKEVAEIDNSVSGADQPEKSPSSKSINLKPDVSEEQVKPADETEAPRSDSSQIVNELAQAAADKKSVKEPETESAEEKQLQNLIENKTYYLPIGQVTKRRNTKILILALVIIVVLVMGGLLMAF